MSEVDISSLSKEEASKLIAAKLDEAYALVSECESIADEHKLSFSFNVAYGMGGWYEGDPEQRGSYAEDGWMSSSANC